MNENKFTPRAEEALRLSQEAAGELGHGYVGTEHLLLGLIREEEGMAHTVLTEAGLTDDMIVAIIKKSVGVGLPGSNPAQGLTPRAKRVVEIAMEDSIRGGYNYVGTEHLLAGILREGNNMAVRILRAAGVEAKHLYTALMQKLNETPRGKAAEARTAASAAKEDSGKNKTLKEFTRDLTADARAGKLDPVIGRDEEIQRVIQILSRRTKNNPCLIGEPWARPPSPRAWLGRSSWVMYPTTCWTRKFCLWTSAAWWRAPSTVASSRSASRRSWRRSKSPAT